MAFCTICYHYIYKCNSCESVGCDGRTGPGNIEQCPRAGFSSEGGNMGSCLACGAYNKTKV